MKWIVKNTATGEYLASARLTVFTDVFARRFNTAKQAKAYIASSGLDKSEWTVLELTEERTGKMTDTDGIRQAVRNNFFKS